MPEISEKVVIDPKEVSALVHRRMLKDALKRAVVGDEWLPSRNVAHASMPVPGVPGHVFGVPGHVFVVPGHVSVPRGRGLKATWTFARSRLKQALNAIKGARQAARARAEEERVAAEKAARRLKDDAAQLLEKGT